MTPPLPPLKFNRPELLIQALTHRSSLNEKIGANSSYERLEFLGDAVLELVVSAHLYNSYPKLPEGKLTRFRANLVQTKTLAAAAQALKLNQYLILSRGEKRSGGDKNPSLLADCFEAVIGAIYLDQGLPAAQEFIARYLIKPYQQLTAIAQVTDYKSLLQEKWQKEGFTSKEHERKFFEKGKFYLSGFLKEEFDPQRKPYLMEQRFTLPLPLMEKERPLKIGGVMDRVDVLEDGSLEIVDYKTGATIPTQSQIDNNLQLTFYALAATSIREEPFNKTSAKLNLSLYFFDTQEKLTTKRTKGELDEAIEEIYKVRREIEESDFKCSGHMFCQNNCEYNLFCRESLQ